MGEPTIYPIRMDAPYMNPPYIPYEYTHTA
jgi:hypothetical protein